MRTSAIVFVLLVLPGNFVNGKKCENTTTVFDERISNALVFHAQMDGGIYWQDPNQFQDPPSKPLLKPIDSELKYPRTKYTPLERTGIPPAVFLKSQTSTESKLSHTDVESSSGEKPYWLGFDLELELVRGKTTHQLQAHNKTKLNTASQLHQRTKQHFPPELEYTEGKYSRENEQSIVVSAARDGDADREPLRKQRTQFESDTHFQRLKTASTEVVGSFNGQYNVQVTSHLVGHFNGQFSGQTISQCNGQFNAFGSGKHSGQLSGHITGYCSDQRIGQFSGQFNCISSSGQFYGTLNGKSAFQFSGRFYGQSTGQFHAQVTDGYTLSSEQKSLHSGQPTMALMREKRQSERSSSLTTDQIDESLSIHNELRRLAEATDMEYMTWNSYLGGMMQEWLEGCVWGHGQPARDPLEMPFNPLGQNLYFTTSSKLNITWANIRFYEEIAYYDYDSNSCQAGKMCGHYTQLMWANSRQMGCAYHVCPVLTDIKNPNKTWTNAHYYGCNYGPAGNYANQRPFKRGSAACTSCGSQQYWCDTSAPRGLCRRDCTEENENCTCGGQCENGGVLTCDCRCLCQAGYTGGNCAEPCADKHTACGKSPGYPKWTCQHPDFGARIRDLCPFTCEVCSLTESSAGNATDCQFTTSSTTPTKTTASIISTSQVTTTTILSTTTITPAPSTATSTITTPSTMNTQTTTLTTTMATSATTPTPTTTTITPTTTPATTIITSTTITTPSSTTTTTPTMTTTTSTTTTTTPPTTTTTHPTTTTTTPTMTTTTPTTTTTTPTTTITTPTTTTTTAPTTTATPTMTITTPTTTTTPPITTTTPPTTTTTTATTTTTPPTTTTTTPAMTTTTPTTTIPTPTTATTTAHTTTTTPTMTITTPTTTTTPPITITTTPPTTTTHPTTTTTTPNTTTTTSTTTTTTTPPTITSTVTTNIPTTTPTIMTDDPTTTKTPAPAFTGDSNIEPTTMVSVSTNHTTSQDIENTTSTVSPTTSSAFIWTVGFSVLGVDLVLLAIIITVICLLKRHRRRKLADEQEQEKLSTARLERFTGGDSPTPSLGRLEDYQPTILGRDHEGYRQDEERPKYTTSTFTTDSADIKINIPPSGESKDYDTLPKSILKKNGVLTENANNTPSNHEDDSKCGTKDSNISEEKSTLFGSTLLY